MVGRGASGSGGGGVSPAGLAGYATQAWVAQNFLSIDFFNRLFKVHGATDDVLPNDTETTITDIEAIFGFWTEKYISALGKNSSGGGGGGSSTLAGLDDVQLNNPQNGQALVYAYDSITGEGKWINGTVIPDLTDYATKSWVQQQGYITASALTGYATESWVQQQDYLTASALTGYATESWVTGKGYATESWVEGKGYALAANVYSKTDADAKFLTVAFFNRLFQAYNGTTSVNANDTTSTIDNIKAMFGFWTNQYISALGKNSSGGGGGGSSTLAGLDDVQLSNLQNGQALVYNNGKWVNGTVTPDLTDYATKAWVQQQGYLTQHQSLAGYATESWVQQQGYITSSALAGYLPLSGGTMTGDLHLGSSAGVSPFIYFGDSSYVYIGEDADDHLTIKGNKGVNFIVGSGYDVTINSANIATQSWVQQQGYLTDETDPTVPAWAKAATKPSYAFSEIGGTVAFSQLPTLYWANVPVGSSSDSATTPTFSALNVTNDAVVGGSVNAKCMELSFSTPFIDFHHNVSNADFTSRFITTGYGVMSLQSKNDGGTSIASAFTIGEGFSGSYLQIGNIRVVYDSTNNALQIIKSDGTPAGLYATGGLSALGMSSVASSITGFSQSVTFSNKAYFDDDIVINVGGTEMYLDTAKCVELGILN